MAAIIIVGTQSEENKRPGDHDSEVTFKATDTQKTSTKGNTKDRRP